MTENRSDRIERRQGPADRRSSESDRRNRSRDIEEQDPRRTGSKDRRRSQD